MDKLYKNIFNNNIIYEKLNYKYNRLNLDIKKLIVYFKIPSKSHYQYGFITMMILLEKTTNNMPIFLIDKKTLSRKRIIKIGLYSTIKKKILENYIQLCMMYSAPKFYTDFIVFNIPSTNVAYSYHLNKILSNSIFSNELNIFYYYNYLYEVKYQLQYVIETNTKNRLINLLILNKYNTNNYINNEKQLIKLLEYAEEQILLDEISDDDIEEIDKIDNDLNIINNIEINNDNINDDNTNNELNIDIEYDDFKNTILIINNIDGK